MAEPLTPSPALEAWLEDHGLRGKKLEKIVAICEEEFIETPDELRKLHEKDELKDVFKQAGLRISIEEALQADGKEEKANAEDELSPDSTVVVPASSNTSSGGSSAEGGHDAKVEWIHESELKAELDEKGQKKCIGSGSFGTVFLASRDGDVVCVKMFNTGATPAAKAEHEKELVVHIQLRHKRIVQLFGACEIQSSLGIVLEYVSGGSLHKQLQHQHTNGSPIDWSLHLRLAKEIAAGVKYLHSKKIIHRDLKSLNVLVDERDGAKLCDFGLAKTKTTSKSVMSAGEKGNMLWMAPGLIR